MASLLLAAGLAGLSCSSSGSGSSEQDAAPVDADLPSSPLYRLPTQTIDVPIHCTERACDIVASEAQLPTREFYAFAKAQGGDEIVFDARQGGGLYWSDGNSLVEIEVGEIKSFSRPVDGKVWLRNAESLRQIDNQGQVWREITDLPNIERNGFGFVEQVGDSVLLGYGVADTLFRLVGSEWEPLEEAAGLEVWDVHPITSDKAVFASYGYAYLWNKAERSTSIKFGGSDDDFSYAIRCNDEEEMWIGGGTGLVAHCSSVGQCAGTHGYYGFQSSSVACVDSELLSLADGTIAYLTPALEASDERRSEKAPPSLRHLWSDRGFKWTMSSPSD